MAAVEPKQPNDDEKNIEPTSLNVQAFKRTRDTVQIWAETNKSENKSAAMLTQVDTLLASQDSLDAAVEDAKHTRPIIHNRVRKLIDDFLKLKIEFGSETEKTFYKKEFIGEGDTLLVDKFIDRLYRNRPLAFIGNEDKSILRDGMRDDTSRKFDNIGKDNSPGGTPSFEDYISYDEICIAALLGISGPTHCVNNGQRNNYGTRGDKGNFLEALYFIGLVGTRFERPGFMEYQWAIVDPDQNTTEKGYGKGADLNNPKTKLLRLWANFFGLNYLPTYEEYKANIQAQKAAGKTPECTELTHLGRADYLNNRIYKERLRILVETQLFEADERGKAKGGKTYLRTVGFGMGVWCAELRNDGRPYQPTQAAQEQLMFEVYREALEQHKFQNISHIEFCWFGSNPTFKSVQDISIGCSQANPADPLPEGYKKDIPMSSLAWDGNSYVGNEWWSGQIGGTGDPDAVSATGGALALTQNPDANPAICAANVLWCGSAESLALRDPLENIPEAEDKEEPVEAAAQAHAHIKPVKAPQAQEQAKEPVVELGPKAPAQAGQGHEQKEGGEESSRAALLADIQKGAQFKALKAEETNQQKQAETERRRLEQERFKEERGGKKDIVKPKEEEHKDEAPLPPPPPLVPTPPKPSLPFGLLILSPLLGLGAGAAVYFYPGALTAFSLFGLAGPILPAVLISLAAAALVGVALGIHPRGPLHTYFVKYPVLASVVSSFILAESASFLLAGLLTPVPSLVLLGSNALPFGLIALGVVGVIGLVALAVSAARKKEAGMKDLDPLLPRSNDQQPAPASDPQKGVKLSPVPKKGKGLEDGSKPGRAPGSSNKTS